MKPNEIRDLIQSPLWIASLLEYFLSGVQRVKEEGLPFELVFLAIPILLDEDSIEHLSKGNINSNISKMMKNIVLQSSYFKAKWNIEYYKPVTKKSIIVLASMKNISIDNNIRLLNPIKNISEPVEYKKTYYKAAYNLGAMIAKEESLDLIIKFGV